MDIFNQIVKKMILCSIIIINISNYHNKYLSILNNIPKISIFLPIYNKGKFLSTSIGSLLTQTLRNIEIVAVNDGSTDESLNELKKLSKIDRRIKIINNDRNHGPLYSRAMGIINSSGEYMMNLDADDKLINDNDLKLIYKKAKASNADFLRFLVNRIPNRKNETYLFNYLNTNQLLYKDFLITNKLILREIYLKAFFFLKERIFGKKFIIHDDNVWNEAVRKFSNTSIILNKSIYYYKRNEKSLNNFRGSFIDLQSQIYRLDMLLKINNKMQNKKFKNFLDEIINYFNYSSSRLPEHELKKNILKNYNHYYQLQKINYYYRKEINFLLNKIFDNKAIIFYDSNDKYIRNYLIYLYSFFNKTRQKYIFIDSKKAGDIMNYIYYNDILIGINNVFFTSEINFIINSHTKNKFLIFADDCNQIMINNINNSQLNICYNLFNDNDYNFLKLYFPNYI